MRCAVYKVLLPVMMITAHRQTHTHRHTETKTVYPIVSLRSLGGYNNLLYTKQSELSANAMYGHMARNIA